MPNFALLIAYCNSLFLLYENSIKLPSPSRYPYTINIAFHPKEIYE